MEIKQSTNIDISNPLDREKIDEAHLCHIEIQQRKAETALGMVCLGRLFKKIRDEKLYKYLDCDTFEEYVALPEISIGRSTVFSFIKIYERYVIKLGFKEEFIAQIGHRRLQIINPVVEANPEEWIYRAKENSESDLINEVRLATGRVPMLPPEKERETVYPYTFEEYEAFVEAHPCIVCDATPSEKAHFPKTKGAGAPREWIIPLCRKCHTEYHQDPYDFLWKYKDKIFGYFYNLCMQAYKVLYEFGVK